MLRKMFCASALALGVGAGRGHAQPPVPRIASGLPAVSPDGKRIAFHSNRDGTPDLYVVNADGSGLARVTNDAPDEGAPTWARDGASILYAPFAMNAPTTQLFAVAPSGGAARVIATSRGRGIVLVRGGTRMLSTPGDFRKNHLEESDLDGGNAKPLSDSSAAIFNVVPSPDGAWIAYARLDSTRDMQTWVMRADGSGARQLTHFTDADGHPQWPSWSPDSRRIAVQAGKYDRNTPQTNTAHIWLVDVATGSATKLAAHDRPYLDETPSFFPDGKRIAIQSDRTGRMEVWVIDVDRKGAVQVTR